MVHPAMRPDRDSRSWLLNPGCLIGIFLDRIEKFRSVVMADKADNLPHRADIARLEQISG
jgi:hypothetical protein